MSDRVQEIPPLEGIPIMHVLTDYEGRVGKIDLRHISGQPHVRIDGADGYKWFPVSECRWWAPGPRVR